MHSKLRGRAPRDRGLRAGRTDGELQCLDAGSIQYQPEQRRVAERDLLVSPQHRILLSHWLAELHFGESEVLVPALHLVNGHSIRRESVARVTYLHIMCDTHQVIWAEGMATETFLPGAAALAGLPDATVAELLALFPELAGAGATAARPARPILRHWESRMLRHDLARGASAA